MLSKEQIESNKNRFLELLGSVDREGIGDLITYIQESDFFEAPASTMYHTNYEGGLCQHSLNVYMNLNFLVKAYKLNYSDDTLKVAALLHDISKVNFYEKYIKKQPLYNENGKFYDELGSFDWAHVLTYKIKDISQRFVAGDHGFNSFLLASKYIPMTDEEMVAILNHHAGMGDANPNRDMNEILNRYPLAFLLHTADMLSCYINENKNIEGYRLKDEPTDQETTETDKVD